MLLPAALRDLPPREGNRPRTHLGVPHIQLTGHVSRRFADRIDSSVTSLPGVRIAESRTSDPANVGYHLEEDDVCIPMQLAIAGGEFAHRHPYNNDTLHVVLPEAWGDVLVRRGWAELHPSCTAGSVPPVVYLLYAARDEQELEVTLTVLELSYRWFRDAHS